MHINFLNQIYPKSPPFQFLPYSCPHNFSLPASCVLLLTCENPLSSFGTGHGCRTIHGAWVPSQGPHLWRKLTPPWPAIAKDHPDIGGNSCAIPISIFGFWLAWWIMRCHVFIHATALSCSDYCRNPLSYRLPLSLWREWWDIDVPLLNLAALKWIFFYFYKSVNFKTCSQVHFPRLFTIIKSLLAW